jgi:hypothetical chaperone protein
MSNALPITACGLDFGTSNSTLAYCVDGVPRLAGLEDGKSTVPSSVFFGQESDDRFLIGRAAIESYVEGKTGRLMRALKSILSNALLSERTPVFRQKISFADIIGKYLFELKARAEAETQSELSQVVLGRPVQFVDNDVAGNILAEQNLANIAKSVGFKQVSFQFEPVAAALEFERQLSSERLALIADIGGGTSDFSIVRLGAKRLSKDRKSDVLANAGVRVGGTDFDRSLSISTVMPSFGYRSLQKNGDLELPSGPFSDLSTWSSVHHLYEPKFMTLLRALRFDAQKPELLERFIRVVNERRCHSLLMEVEQVKMKLSTADQAIADLRWLDKNLLLTISREVFVQSSHAHFDKLNVTILKCLAEAGLVARDIDVIFFTGGTSLIPAVRAIVTRNFQDAEIVNGDQFGAVGLGLGVEAQFRYG